MTKRAGFTLIELLVVVTILGVLSTIGISNLSGIKNKYSDAKLKADVDALAKAYEIKYDVESNSYSILTKDDFASKTIPKQPNGQPYVGCDSDTNCAPGVRDDAHRSWHICAKLSDDSFYCRKSARGAPVSSLQAQANPINGTGDSSSSSLASLPTCGNRTGCIRATAASCPANSPNKCLGSSGEVFCCGGLVTAAPIIVTPTPRPNICVTETSASTFNLDAWSCVGRATPDIVKTKSVVNTNAGARSIIVSSVPNGLSVNDEILIINMEGTSSDYSNVGKYEIKKITGISDKTLTLDSALTNSYDGTTQDIMIQRVPVYASVNIVQGSTLGVFSWNVETGGVLAFKSTGTVTVNGKVDMSGSGYFGGGSFGFLNQYAFAGEGTSGMARQGQTENVQGGGGGGYIPTLRESGGGGGGSHATAGTNGDCGRYYSTGGCIPGVGGGNGATSLYGAENNRLIFGGGGGQGSQFGGYGGGIILIIADSITGTGRISADGADGKSGNYRCGSGGGGAGGTVMLSARSITLPDSNITVRGGTGGTGDPNLCIINGGSLGGNGGNGGSGRVKKILF